MQKIEQVTEFIQLQLLSKQLVRVSESDIADAATAGSGKEQYERDIQTAVRKLCSDYSLEVRQDFDTDEYIFRQV